MSTDIQNIQPTKADEKKIVDKRARILEATYDVFAEKGYEKASISEIVKRADIAKGTFYLYFESKASLPEALADQCQEQVVMKIASAFQSKPDDLYTLFTDIIHGFYEIAESYGDVFKIIASEANIFNLDNERSKASHLVIQPFLKEYQDSGAINPDVDLVIVMRLAESVMHTLAHDLLIADIDVDKEHYIHQTAQFLYRAVQ